MFLLNDISPGAGHTGGQPQGRATPTTQFKHSLDTYTNVLLHCKYNFVAFKRPFPSAEGSISAQIL